MLSWQLQREAILVGRNFLYEEDCKYVIYTDREDIEIDKEEKKKKKICEEFEAQASVFSESVLRSEAL